MQIIVERWWQRHREELQELLCNPFTLLAVVGTAVGLLSLALAYKCVCNGGQRPQAHPEPPHQNGGFSDDEEDAANNHSETLRVAPSPMPSGVKKNCGSPSERSPGWRDRLRPRSAGAPRCRACEGFHESEHCSYNDDDDDDDVRQPQRCGNRDRANDLTRCGRSDYAQKDARCGPASPNVAGATLGASRDALGNTVAAVPIALPHSFDRVTLGELPSVFKAYLQKKHIQLFRFQYGTDGVVPDAYPGELLKILQDFADRYSILTNFLNRYGDGQ